jgi:hypothetical protein
LEFIQFLLITLLDTEINVALPISQDRVNTVKYGFGGMSHFLLPLLIQTVSPEKELSSVDFSPAEETQEYSACTTQTRLFYAEK